MRLSEIDSIDFSKVPAEALVALRNKLDRELHKRKDDVALSSNLGRVSSPKRTWRVQLDKQGNRRKETIFLQELLKQEWGHLFSGSDEPKFYVYAHVLPSTKRLVFDCDTRIEFLGVPFYIGKGTGARAYDLKRNQGHGATINELLKRGKSSDEIVNIVADGLTEPEALALESKLIYFFGTKYEKDRDGILVNLDIPKRLF